MQKSYRIETLADGTQVARAYCWKCGGKGYLPGYEFIDNARCWSCMGYRGHLGEISVEEYTKREERNAKARARRQAKRQEAAEARRAEREVEFTAWKAQHADLLDLLAGYTGASDFVAEVQHEIEQGFEVTDRRAEVAVRIMREALAAQPVPAGRQEVTGTVRSTRWVENAYGGTLKMLVDCGTYRVYGTAPAVLDAIEVGDTVTFTATLEPGRETGFGFFSRPRSAHKTVQAA